jgi:hypothetical protein
VRFLLALVSLLLSILVSVAATAQSISAELPVSAPVSAPADQAQGKPAVATDGNVFLVVWQNAAASTAIFASRVTREGVVIGDMPTLVAETGANPHVAWSGRHFLVAYGTARDFHVTSISSDGERIADQIVGAGTNIACGRTRCIVGGESFAGTAALVAYAVIDVDGRPLSETKVAARLDAGRAAVVDIASNGTNFLLAWQSFNSALTLRQQLFAARINGDESMESPQHLRTIDYGLQQHTVASDGKGYLIAWTLSDGPLNRIEAQRFDESGRTSGDLQFAIPPRMLGYALRATATQSGYFLAATSRYEYEGPLFYTANGRSMSQVVAFESERIAESAVSVASIGDRVMIAWPRQPRTKTDPDIYAAFVEADTHQTGTTFLISRSAAGQHAAALSVARENVVTVWAETRMAVPEIRVSAGDANGTFGEDRRIHASDTAQVTPAIASNGSEFLVVWSESDATSLGRVIAKRVDASGIPIDGSEIVLSRSACAFPATPVVASNGRDFLVAWSECQVAGNRQLVVASIHDGFGGEPQVIAEGVTSFESGDIAWNGDDYLIAWTTTRPADYYCDPFACYVSRAYATRVSARGEVLQQQAVSAETRGVRSTRVIWNGTAFVVLWIDGDAIYAARVRSSEPPSTPTIVLDGLGYPSTINAAFTAGTIDVVWADHGDVFMARIRDDRTRATPFRVTSTNDPELAPVVAALPNDRLAVAYERSTHEREYSGATRVFVRFLEFPARRRAASR